MAKNRSRRMMDRADELPTLVGEEAQISGNVLGSGRLVVYGVVTGDSNFEGGIVLAEGGRWIGTLSGEDVVIAGVVEGDVVAASRLEVGPTARITGGLTAGKIAIAEGAQVEGKLTIVGDSRTHHFKDKRKRWSRLFKRVIGAQ